MNRHREKVHHGEAREQTSDPKVGPVGPFAFERLGRRLPLRLLLLLAPHRRPRHGHDRGGGGGGGRLGPPRRPGLLEPLPPHRAPRPHPAEPVGGRPDADEHRELPVAEVVEEGVEGEHHHLGGRVGPVVEFLDQDREDVEGRHVAEGEREKEREGLRRDRAGGVGEADDEVRREFEEGAEDLEEEVVRHPEKPHRPEAGMKEHLAVGGEGLEEHPVPAVPLPDEGTKVRRDLGPCDRIGKREDPVRHAALPQDAVDAHRHLEVLARRHGGKPPDRDHDIAPPETEGPRDEKHRVPERPPDAVPEKGPEVLEELKPRQDRPRKAPLDDPPVLNHEAVSDPHLPADGDDALRVLHDGLDDPEERVGLEDRVGVGRDDVAVPREVDAALRASALPPFSLSITKSRASRRDRYTRRTGIVGMTAR